MSSSAFIPPIEPSFFRQDAPLFGCYHRPQRQPARPSAVVLCYPMGDEYIRFYRAMRQLAVQLTGAGFPVLRFDWYGSGDSAGEAEEWRLPQWQADLGAAIAEARRRSGSSGVALIGLHIGATLAAIVAAARQDIAATVLWDPVLDGQAHLQQLQALQAGMLRRAHVLPYPPDGFAPAVPEILGFPFVPALRADIAAIDLLALSARPSPHVLIVESDPLVGQHTFADHLRRLGVEPECLVMPNPSLWVWEEGVDTVVVPNNILQAVTAWLARTIP